MSLPQPILLTGFEPFGGDVVNPSATIAQTLSGEQVAGWPVQALILPCVFGAATRTLLAAVRQHRPGLVVCLGLAGGRGGLGLERVAINLADARIADNAGQQPCDQAVCEGGPAAYFARLPLKAIGAVLADAGVPAALSLSAGSFVCNHVFYGLMHALRRRPAVQAGFVHVPWLPERAPAGAAAMPLAEQVRGVRLVLETAVAWRGRGDQLQVGGGLY